jgi:hypothetical protein
MIRRREATRITLHCDICSSKAETYTHTHNSWVDYPGGWTSWPDPACLTGDSDPRIVLCPEHAHLQDTARLIALMLHSQAAETTETIKEPA